MGVVGQDACCYFMFLSTNTSAVMFVSKPVGVPGDNRQLHYLYYCLGDLSVARVLSVLTVVHQVL